MKTCLVLTLGVLISITRVWSLNFQVFEEGNADEIVGNIPQQNGQTYRLSEPSDFFTLIEATGELKTTQGIDREAIPNDVIQVIAVSTASVAPVELNVQVVDINDNPPIFNQPARVDVDIPESTEAGAQYFLPTATDRDSPANSVSAKYSIVEGDTNKFGLLVDSSPGQETLLFLVTKIKFNREIQEIYHLNISATDDGTPSLSGYLSVTINIIDNNDNEPVFDMSEYTATVNENATVGTHILTVHASDLDKGANGDVSYRISERSDSNNLFSVNTLSGVITLRGQLDYEIATSHRLSLEAFDGGEPELFGRAFVTITVVNVNDNNPVISFRFVPPSATIASVEDGATSGTLIALVTATDRDNARSSNSQLDLEIVSGNELGNFRLLIVPRINIGRLQVVGKIDGNQVDRYNLTFRAGDRGYPTPRYSYKYLEVVVNSPNQHPPIFTAEVYRAEISEISPTGSFVVAVKASDADRGITGRLTYSIVEGNINNWFNIDQHTGLITTNSRIHFEQTNNGHINIIVTAQDESAQPRIANTSVIVGVTDENDHPPVFTQAVTSISVPDNKSPGLLLTVRATDIDTGQAGKFEYSIISVYDVNNRYVTEDLFAINATTGEIRNVVILNSKVSQSYKITVEAANQLATICVVHVTINSAITTPPVIYPRKYFTTIQTGSYMGFTLTRVNVLSENTDVLNFRMTSAHTGVRVESHTGDVIITGVWSQPVTFSFEIEVSDSAGVTSQEPAIINVVVTDHVSPISFERSEFQFWVMENSPSGFHIGNINIKQENITYEILDGDPKGVFAVNNTGDLTLSTAVDYEALQMYNLTLSASRYTLSSTLEYTTTHIIILLRDENDNKPMFLNALPIKGQSRNPLLSKYSANINFDLPTNHGNVDTCIYNATAVDDDSGVNGLLIYSLLDPMNILKINETGIVSVESIFTVANPMKNLVLITTCDKGSPQRCSQLNLTMNIRPRLGYDVIESKIRRNYHVILSEDTKTNTRFFDLSLLQPSICASPVQVASNGSLITVATYSFISGNIDQAFAIFPDGQLYLKYSRLNRENVASYDIKILAKCEANSQEFDQEITINIEVSDVNDNPPYFSVPKYTFYLFENQEKNTEIGTVRAFDCDTGIHSTIMYSTMTGNNTVPLPFAVNAFNGKIINTAKLDAETLSRYWNVRNNTFVFAIRATDNNGSYVTNHPTFQTDVTIEIVVRDVNEFAPQCLRQLYVAKIPENSVNGTTVAHITSTDMDYQQNNFEYKLLPSDATPPFTIERTTGRLIVSDGRYLDREVKEIYTLTIEVSYIPTPTLSSECLVEIQLTDVNDNPPVFQTNSLSWSVSESSPLYTVLGQLHAVDPDAAGLNNLVQYSMSPTNTPDVLNTFAVEESSGNIILLRNLDRESVSSYDVVVTSSDSSPTSPMTSTSTCTITVEDANDNAPVFIGQMEFHVTEGEYVTPTSFGTIETNDDDVGANGIVTYRILRQETQSGQLGITIDPNTGELRVRGTLDREKYLPDGLFRITVLATDSAPIVSNQLSKMGIVNVIVDDINDVTPEFTNADTFLVPPNSIANVGYVVGRVHAMDTDAGVNGEVVYSLDTESSIFTINQQTGVIRISNPIQGPGVLYQVEIVAKDKGTPARSNTMVLNVIVGRTDSNNGPVFERSSYTASIVENMAAGTNLVTVTATGNQVAYYITSTTSNSESTIRPFAIHHTTGIISNLMTLDRENGVTSYTVQVVAVDMTSNVNNPRITSTNVVVSILDFNDNPPLFAEPFVQVFVAESAVQGYVISQATAQDIDQSSVITYSLQETSNSDLFRINPRNAEVTLGPNGLDRELQSLYTLYVVAADEIHQSVMELLIHVVDVDDNYPVFSKSEYVFSITEGSPTPPSSGRYIGSIKATDFDETSQITYFFGNGSDFGRFVLDRQTGSIRLNPLYTGSFDREIQDFYSLIVHASDAAGHTAEARAYININDINDNSPIFQHHTPRVQINEDVTIDHYVATMQAEDADLGFNSIVEYYIVAGDPDGNFKVAPDSGVISVAKLLDSEHQGQYNLVVMATDVGPISSRQLTYSDIIIEVLDVNDNTPQSIIPSQIYIGEDTVPGDSVFKVGAIDADISDTNFAFSMAPDDSAFSIDPYTGQVSVANVLNIDITRKYNISIQVQERDISNPFSLSQNFEIILLDANNHAPLFTTPPGGYSARISEDLPVGSLVINIEARDMDDGLNGKVKYKIVGFDKPDQLFTVDAYTGSIYLVGNLDYDQTPNHLVTIEACDQGNPPICSMMNITVELDDVNDMPPVVLPSSTTVEVMEGITNVIVAQLTALDGDTSEGGNVDFRNIVVVAVDNDEVSTTISDSPFTLSHDGVVMLVGSINREEVRHYSLVVTAVDRGQPTLTGTTSIIVKVGDKNEFPPVFQPVSYRVNISEDVDVGTPVVTVATVDKDAGEYGVVRYSISNIENVPFVINPSTGLISTRSRLDRETQGSYILQVMASDSQIESNRRTATTEVMITLDDKNDNPPMFDDLVYEFYTHTSVSQCGVVFASDADIGFNGDVTYSIIPTLAFLPFNIHQQTGVITSTPTLTSPIYNFTITASDGGVPALTSSTNVVIRTTNAVKPVFTQPPTTPVSIHENSPMDGNIIAEFQATTARVGAGNIEYFLRGGNLYNSFSLDRNTGQLVLNNNLDFEKTSSFHLIVEAQDTGLPPVSSLANLTINVVDRNDNPPIFTKHLYTGHVLENGATNQVITAVLASDLDTGRGCMVRYSLRRDEDSDKFQIDPNVGTIRNLVSFDREEKQSYFLTVVAKDEGSPVLSTTTGVRIIIEDINDESPFFTKLFSATVREDAAIGDYVIQVTSTDKDSEQFSMNRYRLRNNENQTFSINPLSGWVVVNKLLDAETQQLYQLEVEVYDDAWSTHTSIHINVININDNPPRFTTSSPVVDVPTHTTSGTQLTIVSAVDADVGPRQNIVYKMETPNDLLRIDQLSGEVFANQDLTCSLTPGYKDSCPYTTTTTISASDTGSPPLSSSMILTIHIRPPNLHPPVFQTPTSTIALLRTSPIGTQAATIHATDDDHNSILSYQISGQHSSYFTINETTGLITTTRNIGFNSRSKLNIVVTATDNGIPPRFSERNLQFEVSETNSYGPNFSRHLFTASSLPENSRIGRKVFVAQALDNDLGINGEVWYSFDNIVDSSKPFSIDANNGSIVTTQALDYEEVQSYSLTIIATDRSVSPRSTHATLIIPITDVDDNPPKFNSSCYIGYIPENSPPETVIMRLSAMDIDTGENAIIQYSVHPQQLILVRSLTGDIYTSPGTALDYETQNSFHLTVTAESDSLTSPPSSLIIQVTGINEFKPQLVSSTLNLVSSVTGNQGKVIGRLEATDPDGGQDGKISFYLAGWSEGLGFVVNSTTGDISVSQGAMLTLGEQISLTVFVKNPGLSNSSDISQASVVVTVVTDECIRSPCMNGAVCEDRINTFACVCAPGYSGSVCETEIDECSSNPCLNGGSCADQVASFTCVCAPGYTGHTCDTDIDYCQDEPCFNGGSCIDHILTYTCVCQFGTTGRNCEVNSLGFEPLAYLGMPTLNSQSNTIFLEFATVSSSALILYNHGGNSSALFVAMELLRGTLRVSYSFNNIRIYRHSVGTNLNDGIFHSVRFTLSQSGASINLDNCLITNDIAGDCSITVAHTPHEPLLDLSTQPLYIGGVPHVQDILDHPGQVSSMDYVGCIRSMVINSMSIYSVSSHFIDQSSGVTDGCVRSNSTSGVGCVEDTCGAGQCTDAWSDVICDCPVGTAGKNCKEKQIGTTFSGSNYLSFAFQPSYVRESLLATSGALYSGGNRKKRSTQVIESSVEITFRTRMSGLLLFINSTSNDFISLYVNKSDVYFHYETSSGVEVQKVEASVSDGAWHSVRLQATQVAGAATFNLSLDGISKLYESFMGKITAFTDPSLVQNIYVGGAPETLSNTWSPLNGCILHFLLNDQQQPLSYDITSGLLVLEQTVGSSSTMPGCRGNDVCASNPCPHDQYCNDIWEKFECIPLGGCASSPCLNQASCIPFNNGSYACSCSTYYMGNLCETYIPCLMVDCSTKGTNQVCVSNGLPGGTTCACKSGYFDLNDFCVPVSVATAGIGWWAYVVIGLVGLLVFALAIWCVRRRYFNLEQKGENGNLQNRKKLQTITPKLNGNNTNGRNNSSYEFDTITRTQLPSLPRPDILSEDVLIVDEEAFSNYAECHNDVCDDSPTPQIADHNDNIPNTEEEANKRSSPLPTYSVVMKSRGPPTLPPMYESERDSNLEQAYKTTQGLNLAYNTTQGLNNAYKTTTSPPLSIISSSSIARPSPPSSRSSTSQHRISDRMGASPPPRMPLLKHKPPVHADQPTNTLKLTPSRTRHVSGSAASSTTTTSSISQDNIQPASIEDMVQHLNGLVGLTREEIELLNENPGNPPSYPSSTTGSVMSSYPPSVEPPRSRKPSALQGGIARPSSLPGRRIDRIHLSGRSRTPMMMPPSYEMKYKIPLDLQPSQFLQPPDTSSDEEDFDSFKINSGCETETSRVDPNINLEKLISLGPHKYEALAAVFADLSMLPRIDETESLPSKHVVTSSPFHNMTSPTSSVTSYQSKHRISFSSGSNASGSRTSSRTGHGQRTRQEHYV